MAKFRGEVHSRDITLRMITIWGSIYSLSMGEATWGSAAARSSSCRGEPGRRGGRLNPSIRSLAEEEEPPEDAEQASLGVSRTIQIMGSGEEKQVW